MFRILLPAVVTGTMFLAGCATSPRLSTASDYEARSYNKSEKRGFFRIFSRNSPPAARSPIGEALPAHAHGMGEQN